MRPLGRIEADRAAWEADFQQSLLEKIGQGKMTPEIESEIKKVVSEHVSGLCVPRPPCALLIAQLVVIAHCQIIVNCSSRDTLCASRLSAAARA